jgi:hypothetical protein
MPPIAKRDELISNLLYFLFTSYLLFDRKGNIQKTPRQTVNFLEAYFREISKIETTNYAHESRGTQIWKKLGWQCPAKAEKYRPDFSSERAQYINKPETVNKKIIKERMGKIDHGSQVGAWYQDVLADWLSVVI